ncbi:MAG: ParB/RepB/Spo0J family partition protein [Defluviitaleaceae bacterium]|nr:ParB/RepB/Spo0J family partition protein [Defluviitaleaceae bacterium]
MTKEILQLPVNAIAPNPYQPRRIFSRKGLDELAGSIKVYGVLQPITVRLIKDSRYELVAGERRLRASRMAGLETIPAIRVDINDLDSAVLAIIENLQRENLHFFEEAEGFRNLMYDYSFTQEAVAVRVGKSQSTVANKLRLLRLPRNIQKFIIENGLTERHARAILRLPGEEAQLATLQQIAAENLTVNRAEEIIEAQLIPPPGLKKAQPIPFKAYLRDIRILTNSIKTDLDIIRRSGLEAQFDMTEMDNGYNINITIRNKNKVEKPA